MKSVFHCSRYTADQIEDILKNGLLPLRPGDIERRVRQLQHVGLIDMSVADKLLSKHQAACGNRIGRIAFCNKADLRDEHGVGWLLSHWGGEALYNSHAEDAVTGPVLRSIGKPSIVEVQLNPKQVQASATVRTHEPVAAEQIIKIHQLGESTFAELTNYKAWKKFNLEDVEYMQRHWP